METVTRNVRLLEPSDQSRPATTPSRRSLTVSSFKHGHNGRRTKLTNGLLRAISDIIEDIAILSISHLNQELLARGHSLSRSTVFRAMEILGMRMDRDKKRWCIGGSGVSLGVGTRVSHINKSSDEGIESSRLPSATRPTGGSFDEKVPRETNDRGMYRHSTGELELFPSQYNHISSNYSSSVDNKHQPRTTNYEGLPIPTGSVQRIPLENSVATGERDSVPATKRFKTVEQTFPKYCGESDRYTKDSGLHRIIKKVSKTLVDDGQTPSTTDRQHTYQMCDNVLETKRSVPSVMIRTMETGRSTIRKRKSDCPAKITPATSHEKSGTAKKQSWAFTPNGLSTVYGMDFDPQSYRGHDQECFGSTPQEDTPHYRPMSSGVSWLTDCSSQEVTRKGNTGKESNRSREQEVHQPETQTRGVMVQYKLPVDGRGRDGTMQMFEETQTCPPDKHTQRGRSSHKTQLCRAVIQNSQTQIQKNVPDEGDLCKTSDSQIIPQEPESAKTLQQSDKKPLKISLVQSQHFKTVEQKLHLNSDSASTNSILNESVASGKNATSLKSKCRELNQAPKISEPRHGGVELSFPRKDNVSADKVRGTTDEQGLKTTNDVQTEFEENSKEVCDLRLKPTDTKQPMIQDLNIKHRSVNREQASRSLHAEENGTPRGSSDPEGSSSLAKRPETFNGTDSQTARLHALTSSLAVKTSNRMTSQSPRSECPRWRKDVESVASTRINCQHSPSQPSTTITPSRSTALTSSETAGHKHNNFNVHVFSDADAALSTRNVVPNIREIQFWMQDISQKMASMQQQLNYLTQITTSRVTTELSNNGHINAMSPSTENRKTGDLEEQQVDRFSEAGDDDDDLEEDEEEEEEQADMQRWGRNLPLINTLESEDMISTLLSNARWESLSPFVGGPRLAIQLARDCIFGPEVLMRSTVTGRNGMNPLHRDGIKKIKDCMMDIYGTRCSHVEFELLWKMARESLSQLCKRIRRRHTAEVNEQEVNSRELNGCDVESHGIIKPEIE